MKGKRVIDDPRRFRPEYGLEESEIDEMGMEGDERDANRVSFLHTEFSEGMRSCQALHSRYRSVNIKYFKQILFGRFQAENLTNLGHGLTNRGVSDTPQDPKGATQMIQCFGVYAMAVIYFAEPLKRFQLTWALEEYRYLLADYSYAYKFDSVREYNYAFMTARILEGQDDAIKWRSEDQRCTILLRLKPSPNEATKAPSGNAAKSALPGHGICRNFNEGRCTRERALQI